MNSIHKKNISIGININNENTEIKNISLKGKKKSNSKLPISNKPKKTKHFMIKIKIVQSKKIIYIKQIINHLKILIKIIIKFIIILIVIN